MPYTTNAACVLVNVRDARGTLVAVNYHLQGSMIPELNDAVQREMLLEYGFVTELDTPPTPEELAQERRIKECADAMDELDIAPTVGAPSARKALRANGYQFSNEAIAEALKWRRLQSQ